LKKKSGRIDGCLIRPEIHRVLLKPDATAVYRSRLSLLS
jgi:hypothetical protein